MYEPGWKEEQCGKYEHTGSSPGLHSAFTAHTMCSLPKASLRPMGSHYWLEGGMDWREP